jgi:hypothetical protein
MGSTRTEHHRTTMKCATSGMKPGMVVQLAPDGTEGILPSTDGCKPAGVLDSQWDTIFGDTYDEGAQAPVATQPGDVVQLIAGTGGLGEGDNCIPADAGLTQDEADGAGGADWIFAKVNSGETGLVTHLVTATLVDPYLIPS